jgi:hypothetical protein
MGNSTIGSTEVTPKGTASETHQTNIQAPALSTGVACSESPKYVETTHTKAAITGPKSNLTIPFSFISWV